MKSSSLFLIIGALALGACSSDEPLATTSDSHSAISLRPAMGAASRATETTNSNLSDINVTALMGSQLFFHDLTFSKGTDGFFNSTIPYYWPEDDTPLTFYAYSPSMDELGADVTITADSQTLESFAVADEIADQVDFITSTGTGTKTANETSGLELTFGHRLSQIEIRAKADNAGYDFKVSGVRIGRPEYMGTYDFAKNAWTLDDWHDTAVYTSYCSPVSLTADAVNIMGDSGNAMLIPQTLTPWDAKGDPDNVAREAYLSVYVRITTKDGAVIYPTPTDTQLDPNTGAKREYAWASIPLSGTWEQGKKYVYTLDFSHGAGFIDPDDPTPGQPVFGDPIKFTTQVTDWTDADQSIPMPATYGD